MGIEPQRRVSYYASAPAFDSHSLFIIALHYVRALRFVTKFRPYLSRLPNREVCAALPLGCLTVYDLINHNDPDYEDYEKECQILLEETSHVHGVNDGTTVG